MRRALTLAPLLAAVLALATSCGDDTPPPPEGFHLNLRFMSLDPTVLDRVEVIFEAQGTGEEFMAIEPMSYADGAITLEVDTNRLTMTIAGSNIAAFAEDQGDGSYVYDLEVFSDDEVPRTPAPSVRVIGVRGGEQIAEGFLFLPQWPLPLGQTSVVNVPCRMAVADRCIR